MCSWRIECPSERVAADTIEWLWESSANGVVPSRPATQEDVENVPARRLHWGEAVKIGVPGHDALFQLITKGDVSTHRRFWDLPDWLNEHLRTSHANVQSVVEDYSQLPDIRYDASSIRNALAVAEAVDNDNRQGSSGAASSERAGGEAPMDNGDRGPDVRPDGQNAASMQALAILRTDLASQGRGRRRGPGRADERPASEWGASFDDCIVGQFAIVQCDFDGDGDEGASRGITLLKITSVDADNKTFTGKPYDFRGYSLKCHDPEILSQQWYPRNRAPTEEEFGYNVLYYFKTLTTAKKIPSAARKFVHGEVGRRSQARGV